MSINVFKIVDNIIMLGEQILFFSGYFVEFEARGIITYTYRIHLFLSILQFYS